MGIRHRRPPGREKGQKETTSGILFILEREPAMGKDGRRDNTGKALGKRHKKSRRKNGSAGRRNSPSGRGRNRKRWDVHIPGEAAPGGNLSGGENGGAGQNMRGYRQSLRCRNAGGRNVPPASIGGRDIPAGKRGETPPAVQRNLWFLRGQALEDGHPGAHFPSHQHFTVFAGEADQAFIGIGKVQADIPVKTLCQEPG